MKWKNVICVTQCQPRNKHLSAWCLPHHDWYKSLFLLFKSLPCTLSEIDKIIINYYKSWQKWRPRTFPHPLDKYLSSQQHTAMLPTFSFTTGSKSTRSRCSSSSANTQPLEIVKTFSFMVFNVLIIGEWIDGSVNNL